MNIRVRIAILAFTSLIVLVSQISLSLALYSSSATVATSGTIVYHTYIVATLAELNDVLPKVVAGDIVYIRGGVYYFPVVGSWETPMLSQSGITLESYLGEKAVFDGSKAVNPTSDIEAPLIFLTGSSTVLRNIEVRNSPGAGVFGNGDNNLLDHVEAHHCRGHGILMIGNNCQFLYCSAHDNSDPQAAIPGGDADGFEAGPPGTGAYFLGCLSFQNSDDGFDCFGSTGNTFEKCIAYGNGLLQGDGVGFKLYGENNRAIKCIAYNNRLEGFALGYLSSGNIADHCTAYNNGKDGFTSINLNTLTNNIGTIWYDTNPIQHDNTWNLGITNYGFVSTNSTSVDFLSLRADSLCRGKASDGSDLGALQYGERISDLLGT